MLVNRRTIKYIIWIPVVMGLSYLILFNRPYQQQVNSHQDEPKLEIMTGPLVYDNITYHHQSSKLNRDFFINPNSQQSELNKFRSEEIKSAFLYAWRSYKTNAWGHDGIHPISMEYSDDWQKWGVNLVDSLDTMLLMNLEDQYQEALEFVERIDFNKTTGPVKVFETIIRYLGGLLGAYELRPDPILLKQAKSLADRLLPAFDTKSGLNTHSIDFETGELLGMSGGGGSPTIIIAELGSLQLEFVRLSQLTKDPIYATKAQKIIDIMDNLKVNPPGLYPLELNCDDLSFQTGRVSLGAMGDSFYEYLLKRYLLTNQTEPQYLRMYTESIDSMYSHLTQQRGSEYDNIMVLGELDEEGEFNTRMDHLSCFVPGMLSLGGLTLNRTKDFLVSQELLRTCYQLYNTTITGLGPELVTWDPHPSDKFISPPSSLPLSSSPLSIPPFSPSPPSSSLPPSSSPSSSSPSPPTTENLQPRNRHSHHKKKFRSKYQSQSQSQHHHHPPGFHLEDPRYLLRPETLESIFYAYRITGDPQYQDEAWRIFKSIETYCRTDGGYAEYLDVNLTPSYTHPDLRNDYMQSFFLAETLKYLYLIFSPTDTLPLTEFVLNTEAHPLKITHPSSSSSPSSPPLDSD